MSEKPILFSGPMVRAILDGKKTMTRRVMKKQPDARCTAMIPHGWEWLQVWDDLDGQNAPRGDIAHRRKCPYGQPGDRLWVRETWRYSSCSGYTPANGPARYQATLEYKSTYDNPINFQRLGKTVELPEMHYGGNLRKDGDVAWKPSIHMPRWASRITLRVESVRVERLQEISDEDVLAEGVDVDGKKPYPVGDVNREYDMDFSAAFMDLWDGINEKRGYGWMADPWVWVVGFSVVMVWQGRWDRPNNGPAQ